MPTGVPIAALDPQWILHPGRYGVGVSISCPQHRGLCRLELYFRAPLDGYGPIRLGPLVDCIAPDEGESLDLTDVTIYGPGHDHLISIPGHWVGYVDDGIVFTVTSREADEEITDPMIPLVTPGEDA